MLVLWITPSSRCNISQTQMRQIVFKELSYSSWCHCEVSMHVSYTDCFSSDKCHILIQLGGCHWLYIFNCFPPKMFSHLVTECHSMQVWQILFSSCVTFSFIWMSLSMHVWQILFPFDRCHILIHLGVTDGLHGGCRSNCVPGHHPRHHARGVLRAGQRTWASDRGHLHRSLRGSGHFLLTFRRLWNLACGVFHLPKGELTLIQKYTSNKTFQNIIVLVLVTTREIFMSRIYPKRTREV